MTNLYRTAFRGYLIDHHSPDPPVVTLDKLDVKEYEAFFRIAGINNLMLYCKDHWGVTYYNTKIGKRHPGLKEDWIARLKPILERHNIEFNAYYCMEYDNLAPKLHPDWSILQADGSPLRLSGRIPKWRMPCYETGYRAYLLAQLEEIVSGYKPDSLFLDIFGKSLCYCPNCKKKFNSQFGYHLPIDSDGLACHNKDIIDFLNECAKKMLLDILGTVKSIDPELKVTINFASLYPKNIRDLLDYEFTEPWAGNWLSAAYARDTASGGYPQLGPGDVSEVYNYRDKSVYTLAASEIAAQGCRILIYSGSQHPDGTLEFEEADRVGAAYGEILKFEQYLQNREVIADIGIISSDYSCGSNNKVPVTVNAIERCKLGNPQRDALLGAMKLCDYSKYTWNIIPDWFITKEKLSRYKVLVLPELYYINPYLEKLLRNYVESGGILIVSAETGFFDGNGKKLNDYALADLYGCSFIETDDRYISSRWSGYLDLFGDDIWKYVPDTYPPIAASRHKIKIAGGRSLASFIEPAVMVTDETWVNWWCPPPAYHTGEPSIIESCTGKGKTLFFAFNFFDLENRDFNFVRGIFKGALEKYISDPVINLVTEYPEIIGFICYDRPLESQIIIHEVSHMAEKARGETPSINGGILNLNTKKINIKKAAIVYPMMKDLVIQKAAGFARIELPPLTIHQIIVINY